MPHYTQITTSAILGLIKIHTWAHVNQTILRMLRNHPKYAVTEGHYRGSALQATIGEDGLGYCDRTGE
jgi:hypothetical protein